MRDDLPLLLTAAMIRQHLLPIGRRTMQRYIAAGGFPQPDLKLGGKSFWRRERVLAWIEDRATAEAGR